MEDAAPGLVVQDFKNIFAPEALTIPNYNIIETAARATIRGAPARVTY
jgi:hypothetical protein